MNNGFCEMMVHIPICSYPKPSFVVVLNNDNSLEDSLKKELNRHKIDKIEFLDLNNLKDINNIDIIISTSNFKDDIDLIYNSLKDDGIFVFVSNNNLDNLKDDLKKLSKFWIAMPFRFEDYFCIFASKKYHPTADIILDRSDLIDGLEYYNSDLQLASFVMPTYIKKELLNIAKN